MHTHSLSVSTGFTVPQPEVSGALGTISWAELGQITIVSARAALPAGWVQLAVLTAGSIGGTLCSWPQLAGEVVTARIGAFIWETTVTLLARVHKRISTQRGHGGQAGQPFKEAAAHPIEEGFFQGLSAAVAEVQTW